LRDQEERELKKAGNKRYKEIAEKNYRERLLAIAAKGKEMDREDRMIIDRKKERIENAARRMDEPLNDSEVVEALFDFLPDNGSEAPQPTAFRVRIYPPLPVQISPIQHNYLQCRMCFWSFPVLTKPTKTR